MHPLPNQRLKKKAVTPAPEAPTPPPAPVAAAPESSDSAKTASPSARKLARERGIELDQVQSKDPIGRVYQDDVKSHNNQAQAPAAHLRVKPQQHQVLQRLEVLPIPNQWSVSGCLAVVQPLRNVW